MQRQLLAKAGKVSWDSFPQWVASEQETEKEIVVAGLGGRGGGFRQRKQDVQIMETWTSQVPGPHFIADVRNLAQLSCWK